MSYSWLIWGGAVSGLLVAFAACATAGGDEGDGSGGSGNTGTGAGGAGGSASGVGGSISTGGAGGSGGQTGPTCDELPCKLVAPQCGCEAGERCLFSGTDKGCAPEGDKVLSQACSNDCGAGMMCADGNEGAGLLCHDYCVEDADCDAPGGLCLMTMSGMSPEKLCTHNCDPVSAAGCYETATSKCDIFSLTADPNTRLTQCVGVGTGTAGTACTESEDCAKGLGCFNDGTSTQCLYWCMISSSSCPVGTCTTFTTPMTLGTIEYGACVII